MHILFKFSIFKKITPFLSFSEVNVGGNSTSIPSTSEWCRQQQPPRPQAPQPTPFMESSTSTVEDQLQVTREKMEQLKRIMEERKAKRRARREARASPYSTSWSLKTSQENQQSMASPLSSPLTAKADLSPEESGQSNSAASATSSASVTSAANSDKMFNNNNPELEPVTA